MADEEDERLEEEIHQILFPASSFRFAKEADAQQQSIWLNAKCDVQAIWSHIHAKRDVFVTSDRNFHKVTKKPHLLSLGAGMILRPSEVLEYLTNGRSVNDLV